MNPILAQPKQPNHHMSDSSVTLFITSEDQINSAFFSSIVTSAPLAPYSLPLDLQRVDFPIIYPRIFVNNTRALAHSYPVDYLPTGGLGITTLIVFFS